MKKNNKAFTLVELLVVITIVAILSVVVTIVVTKYVKAGKTEYDVSLKNQILLAGRSYYSDNKDELPYMNGTGDVVTMSELSSKDFISKDIVNSKQEDCSDSYVVVKKDNGDYKYNVCLVCAGKFYNIEGQEPQDEEACKVDNLKKYTIIYNANGGSGTMAETIAEYDKNVTLDQNNFTRKSYTFEGWALSKKATEAKFRDKAVINKTEGDLTDDTLTLYAVWKETIPPTCVYNPTNANNMGWKNSDVTVTIGCKDDESGCKSESITKTYTTTTSEKITIYDNAGNSRICEVNVSIDKTKPTAKLSRSGCTTSFTASVSDTGGSGVKYYAYSNSSSTPTSWKAYTGSLPQPGISGTVYLHVKDGAGNTGVSSAATSYTPCSASCGTRTDKVTTYYWGEVKSTNCSASNHSVGFDFRWYNCTCTIDKLVNKYCNGKYSAKNNTSGSGHGDNKSFIYYRTKAGCQSHSNGYVKKICSSDNWNLINKKSGDMFTYHGYKYYYGAPSSDYNQFKLGYWYHNGGKYNNTYQGGASAYNAACNHACSVIYG